MQGRGTEKFALAQGGESTVTLRSGQQSKSCKQQGYLCCLATMLDSRLHSTQAHQVHSIPALEQSGCLCRAESIRTAFMLAQGGEFAFVLLSLAAELKVLPEELNKLLIIVVVITMALTPGLAAVGKYLADRVDEGDQTNTGASFDSKPNCRCILDCKLEAAMLLALI